MPLLSKPKGVTVRRMTHKVTGQYFYDATIKTKGRSGARTRMALQNLNFGERQYFLSEWYNGRQAVV